MNHLDKHSPRFCKGSLIIKGNSLPHRNFLPDKNPPFLCKADNVLVLGIVRKSYHIDPECLRLGNKHLRVRAGEGPAHPLRNLLVERNTAHKHRLTIEEDFLSLDLDVPETDPLADTVIGTGNSHIVKFWILPAPPLKSRHRERDGGRSKRICRDSLPYIQFRNLNATFQRPFFRKFHRGVHKVRPVLVQPDEIVLDKHPGSLHKHNIPGDSAVVPPVEIHCRNSVRGAAVAHLDAEEIVFLLQFPGHLNLERSETTLVLSNEFSVEIDPAPVADGPEVKEVALRSLRSVKMAGVPHRPFVVFQLRRLGVPVPGHIQTHSAFE